MEKNKIERVSQSQLGGFINLIEQEYSLETIKNRKHLASLISREFSVDCRRSDITKFYELDNEIPEASISLEPSEFESRSIKYNINANY